MRNWGVYIFNYFDHRYTNAYVERLNGVIDDANRVGRGYKFATLFMKMMLLHSAPKPPRVRISRSRKLLDGTYQISNHLPIKVVDRDEMLFAFYGPSLSTLKRLWRSADGKL